MRRAIPPPHLFRIKMEANIDTRTHPRRYHLPASEWGIAIWRMWWTGTPDASEG